MKKSFFVLILLAFTTLISCQKKPVASFDVSPANAKVGEAVTFTNTSTNGDTYNWNFGDGSQSTIENPTHTYANVGSYGVTLEVASKNGKEKDAATVALNVTTDGAYIAPVASFSYSPTLVIVGADISFTDHSTNNPSGWHWDF
jgi:PKD repeat protein